MAYYRITITPLSTLGTPLVSGTLWGHIAWAIYYVNGEKALKEWLLEQEDNPWLFSSFMPAGMLPRPLLKPPLRSRVSPGLGEMRKAKRIKKQQYVEESIFLQVRSNLNEAVLERALGESIDAKNGSEPFKIDDVKAHNRIDRLTGSTPESGGLYFEEVQFFRKGAAYQGFAYTPVPCRERLESLLGFVGENGFGRNASTGNGYFQCGIKEEAELFSYEGNRLMSLSHGVMTGNMRKVRYKQHVHFGKIGGHYANGSFSPFKYPLLMMCPGATFKPADNGPFGALLHGVHHDPALSSIVHHALHLPLAFSEVDV